MKEKYSDRGKRPRAYGQRVGVMFELKESCYVWCGESVGSRGQEMLGWHILNQVMSK